MAKHTKAEQAEALARLKQILSPGDTVYVVQRHVSRSGMQRHLDLYAFKPCAEGRGCDPIYLTGYAATVLGRARAKGNDYAMVVNGCGMNMHFEAVYELARAMFDKGDALRHRTL